jgi:hypothetical protein
VELTLPAELRATFAPEWRWSVTLEQRFQQQLWRFLELNLQCTLAYDRMQSRKLQYRQRLGNRYGASLVATWSQALTTNCPTSP